MSKFHSVMSRRDFMKAIGLAGAGLGAIGLASPTFHDLDEVASSPSSIRKRAWWIKEVDHPTVDIDWDIMARHHGGHSTQSKTILARYYGYDEVNNTKKTPSDLDMLKANEPGWTLRDQALGNATNGIRITQPGDKFKHSQTAAVQTPEQLGVPKWTGSHEEAWKMMRAVMVFFGASDIGVGALDDHHKKLVGLTGENVSTPKYFPYNSKASWPPPTTVTKPIEFVDEQKFSWDSKTGITYIPNIPLWSVTYTVPMNKELICRQPSALPRHQRYTLREQIRARTQDFLIGIGYQSMHDEPYRVMPGQAGAVLGGLAETARHTIMCISPDYGNWQGYFDLLTDLPMEENKPIDAGLWRFCHSCGVCAENCPSYSIEPKGGREASFEPYPSSVTPKHPPLPGIGWDPLSAGNSEYFKTGAKRYWTDMVSCWKYYNEVGCQRCWGTCTFNSLNAATVHDFVRAAAATTSLFNGFFAGMHKAFGYGLVEGEAIEDWWEMSLPAYGYSTTVLAKNGGYRK